ncbi:MAG: sucrose phosphorylase [Candidatus Nanopelagicales bacterium]
MRNRVHLIAYADRCGGDLAGLGALLRGPWSGVYGGVHVLPFYTPYDGADAGFDPIDHTEVDPRLGTWADIASISSDLDVMVDVIVNHVSADSAAFRDVRHHGDASPWASMFLTMGAVFPDGALESDLTAIYRPRPGLPFTPMAWGDDKRLVWTTFTPQQVDIDVRSGVGRAYLESILDRLAEAGVSLARLDAVGYAIKTAGTSCFMTPETIDFVVDFTRSAHARGIDVLVEVHSYYRDQIDIARLVDRVYDFALPPLVLHAAYTGDHEPLINWLRIRPDNSVTVLDTHDGIGIVDVGPDARSPGRPGLLDAAQLDALVEGIHERTGGQSRLATGWAASNVDIYQVNSTFLDALGGDARVYLAARALQFFVPGIPQVYYVGALGGRNDMDLLTRSGVGRDINRHHYRDDEIRDALEQPVVQALSRLARLRNDLPAFGGDCRIEGGGSGVRITRTLGDDSATLEVDLASGFARICWSGPSGTGALDDLLAQSSPAPA